MKNIKGLGIILTIFLFSLGPACAQEQPDSPGQPSAQTEPIAPKQPGAAKEPAAKEDIFQKMKTNLNLTDSQTDALKLIIEEYVAKGKELLETLKQQGVDKNIIRSRMEQLIEEQDQQISKILSPEQMANFKTMRAERRFYSGKRLGE